MIWLLRHGEAEDGEGKPDSERELTKKGRRQAEVAGKALAGLGVKLDACLTSPKVRALDTAKLTCKSLGVEPEIAPSLKAGDFDPLGLAAGRGEVLLVGHEPDFSRAIAAVTGSRVKLKKGGLAAFDYDLLHVLFRPKDLTAIVE